MSRNLSLTQLILLLGGAVLIVGFLVLLVYALHKAFQRQRQRANLKLAAPRPRDESAFMVATMQGVIARLKAREKELTDLLREAEQQAEASARVLETVVREIPTGLMIFNREGFLTLSNPMVRAVLGTDTWSRRRYPEILGPDSQLTVCIRNCLEDRRSYRRETIQHQTSLGEARALEISLSPCYGRNGQVEGCVCLLAHVKRDAKS